MIVCIAEKPSAARDIANVLGARVKHQGYLEGNGYCVTWTFGHLCTLKEPHEYHSEWKQWSLSHLPMIPETFGIKLIENRGIETQFEVIKRLVAQAEYVVNCGDAGQEGELIQRWVLQKAGCQVPVKRLWLSSMTEEAIKEAFTKLKPASAYKNLYYAGLSRAVGDWLLGLNATRLYTLMFKPPGMKGIVSVGRVQTPTLALIVERQWEIENFVSQPFWELKTVYRDTSFSAQKGRYENEEEAQKVLNAIQDSPLEIKKVEKKKGKEGPPRLFDLTSLQIECNKKWAYTADDTLKLAQSLYEKKLLTYPRVDTTYLTNDIYKKCTNILGGMLPTPLGCFISPLLNKKLPKNKKFFNDSKVTDHHAIIPTGVVPGAMSEQERNVYDLVARRFVSSFYPDAIIDNTTVLAEVAKVPFKATGKKTAKPGWKIVYEEQDKESNAEDSDDEGSAKDSSKDLPTFVVGEQGPHKPDLVQKSTQAPKYYTEATLLNAMETAGKLVDDEDLKDAMKQKGIGRPSTRSAIIETIQKREYVEKRRKNLIATSKGVNLIRTIQNDLLKSVRLTGEWEYKLQMIDRGTYDAETFMAEMKTMVQDLVQEVMYGKKAAPKYEKPGNYVPQTGEQTNILCPYCSKGYLIKGNAAYGCSRYADGCQETIPFKACPDTATLDELEAYCLVQKDKK